MDINLLPDELWIEIFSKMTAKERRPFRIACRRWKNCCNRLQIQKMEKLHLPGVNHFEDIVETITTIERSILNLKISNHQLDSFDSDAWWQWVGQVEKLELENCVITDCYLEKILTCSEKLSHLTLRDVHIMMNSNRKNPLHEYNDNFATFFIKLNELNIVATRVKTLVIYYYECFRLNDLLSLISVFPNVVKLKFSFPHILPTVRRGPVYVEVGNCEKLIKHMATKLLQLETLIIKLHDIPPFICKCEKFLREVSFSRLKTFKFYNNTIECLYPYGETQIYIPQYYSFITNSHSQHLIYVEFLYQAKTEDIINVLKNHTSLRTVHIKLVSVKDSFEFVEFYKALANSKLDFTCIKISIKPDWIRSLHQILDDRSLPVNSTVKDMVITSEYDEDIFISIFQKCFSALKRLKVKTVNDRNVILANIFNQTNLKCVELRSKQSWNHRNELSTLKSTTSVEFVENLECLSIEIGILKKILVQQPSIFFSNLRQFHILSPELISHRLPLTKEDLRCLPLHNLEKVYMSSLSCIGDVFTFFSNPLDFPRIQFIGIRLPDTDSIRQSQQRFQSWFESCPCLKTIFLEYSGIGICLCYDPIKGQVQEFKTEPCYALTNLTKMPLMFRYYRGMRSWNLFWLGIVRC